MTTATNQLISQSNSAPVLAPTLIALVTALFGLNLREKLNAQTTGDQADAAYHWGM